MIATKTRQLRRLRITFGVAVAVVLVADVATIYVRHNDAKPVTVHDALNKYRSDLHHTPTPAPTPTHAKAHHFLTPTPIPTPTDLSTPVPVDPSHSPVTTTAPQPSTSPTPSQSHRAHPTTVPSATPTPTASPLSLPPQGVYAYSTTGSEGIGVPGGSRSYPKTSTITVEKAGCGVSEQWQPNTQHSETRQLCLHHGTVRLAGFSTHVAFFGVGSTESYTCGQDAVVYSPDQQLGHSTVFSCSSSDSTAKQTVTPVGFTHLTVDGTSVRVLHVTVASALSGANQGTSLQHLWLSTDHSVLVKNTGRIDATQGGVNYHERYSLTLQHLTPQQ